MNTSEDQRYLDLVAWASTQVDSEIKNISLLSGDASFRRYFRVVTDNESLVLVDALPAHEENSNFVQIAFALEEAGVIVPDVEAMDGELGFMLITDLGDNLLLDALDDSSAKQLYSQAIDDLLIMQRGHYHLDPYDDEKLLSEMMLFQDWFLTQLLHYDSRQSQRDMLSTLYQQLIIQAQQQPQGFVHRDYHSRNIMRLKDGRLGHLDFQDAVIGPVTYDLVSLLKDCYIAWPQNMVESLALQYRDSAVEAELFHTVDDDTFIKWFDWMGLQRHIKCIGIFSRLNLRDNKPNYMADIPRVMTYIQHVTEKYSEFSHFNEWIMELQELLQHHESNVTSGGSWQSIEATD